MRSRHALTAALALSVVTILTVAACGSSVQGSAQVNTAAAESATSAATTSERTSRTSTAAPTDLSDLSSMLNDLSTAVPSDLSDLSDIPVPTDLSGLFDANCIAVSTAYGSIFAKIGQGTGIIGGQDLQDLQQYLDQVGGDIPAELAPDFQALEDGAKQAQGKDLIAAGQILDSEPFKSADQRVQAWIDANCGGN